MTYATIEGVNDADSHLMELTDWLAPYADPDIRDQLSPLRLGAAGGLAAQAVADAEARRGDTEAALALEERLMTAKGWAALGAFDPIERSRALDLLGFARQLVFPTFAGGQFRSSRDPYVLYGGTVALNRAMADFCAHDPRLLAVGFAPLRYPDRAEAAVAAAIEAGCAAIQVQTDPGDLGPTHADFDRMWARMAEAGVPFVLHIGGQDMPLVDPGFHRNGVPVTDFIGGGENLRAKDYVGVSHQPEAFLSAMVLDGMFDRHPALRGAAIELGAVWVPGWLTKIDLAQHHFRRSEPLLSSLSMKPSEFAHRHLRFTPFVGEPVGWLIEQCGDDMFMFSSDYPHPEGSKDPIARFEATMASVGDDARHRFYVTNFEDLVGAA